MPAAGPAPGKASPPATAFDALLTGKLPVAVTVVAEAAGATNAEPAAGEVADPVKAEAGDAEAGDASAVMGLWLQWMRPMAPATPKAADAAAGKAAAPAPEPLSGLAKAAQLPASLDLLALPSTAEPPLAEPETLAAPVAGNAADFTAAAFATVLDTTAATTGAPTAVPDPSLVVPQSPVQGTAATAAAPTTTPLPTPAPTIVNTQQADWAQQLGEHIAWSLDEQHDAVIELHPAELGSLSVRVEMRGNDAQVTIVAATANARDLLQQSLPQLRELLSVQGLNLSRAHIERSSSAGQTGNQAQADGGSRERSGGLRSRRQLGGLLLVDAYA